MYGKMLNGNLIKAPTTLTVDSLVHYHPSGELYESCGYMAIVETPYPETETENTGYYTSSYEVQEGQIVKVWTIAQPPIEEAKPPTIEDRVTSLENELSATQEAVDYLIMGSEV